MKSRMTAIAFGALSVSLSVVAGWLIGRYSPLSRTSFAMIAGVAYAIPFALTAFPVAWAATHGNKLRSLLITLLAATIGAQFGVAVE